MRTVLVVFLLTCVGIAPCLAGSSPSVTAQVNVVDGFKQYVYTLTNDLDSAVTISGLSLWMPEYGATSVTSFTCSKPNWSAGSPSIRDGIGVWHIGAATGAGIAYGEQGVFTLTTPASVPTSYTYKPPFDVYPSDWQWNWNFGASLLPVPVPEPSGLIILGSSVGCLIPLIRRRR